MDEKLRTIINLEQSNYAHCFEAREMIHKEEFDNAMRLIRDQHHNIKPDEIREDLRPVHHYNTISVFGERGTGKTSFLCSVLQEACDKDKEIEVLNIIDPTLIEEKEHIFLLVVSQINEAVMRKMVNNECKTGTTSFQQRNMWNQKLQKLAKGLPTLEKVGADHKTKEWQSHEFIMERGLDSVHSAFNLEHDFHMLVKYALEILDKKAFLLMLDDIDVDMHKGWDVLEMLRKYVTTPQIITILSGNLKLYSLNVRKHQWEQLKENLEYEKDKGYTQTVNELEGQYLLKVLKPENRIHLNTLKENITNRQREYIIKGYGDKELTIQEVYKSILNTIGVKGRAMQNVYLDYLLSLSVRTQIQFIKGNIPNKNISENIESFLSRLGAANVNVNAATSNVQMLDIIIQKYIESQKLTPELYLLVPNSDSEDINACMTAFTILFARESVEHPFLLFDYFVRLGYMRNVRLGLSDKYSENFYDRTGLLQRMSLKNNVGLSQAYCIGFEPLMASHTLLPGLAEKDKKGVELKVGRIDYEVKEHGNMAQNVTAYLPLNILRFTERNDTKVYYSFYSLMAVLTDLLKVIQDDSDIEVVKAELLNLQMLRSYPTWTREDAPEKAGVVSDYTEQGYNDGTVILGKEGDKTFDALSQNLISWAREYKEQTPPYLIGRIATRIFYSIQKITSNTLGEQMHRVVVAFLNACLIEELREHYIKTDKTESLDRLNTSNAITADNVFLNNVDFVLRNKVHDSIKFTIWMAKCPLIWCFLKPGTLAGKTLTIGEGADVKTKEPFKVAYDSQLNVYDLLERVVIRENSDEDKPVFSGGLEGLATTIRILEKAGRDPKALAEDKRDSHVIADELHRLHIFKRKPYPTSIDAYRTNYKKVAIGTSGIEDLEKMVQESLLADDDTNETGAAVAAHKRPVKKAINKK